MKKTIIKNRHILVPTTKWIDNLWDIPYKKKTIGKARPQVKNAALNLVHLINFKRYTEKDRDADAQFPLHGETVAKYLMVSVDTFEDLREALAAGNVIDWKPRKKKRRRCYKYGFTEEWQKVELERSEGVYEYGFVDWSTAVETPEIRIKRKQCLDRSSIDKEKAYEMLYVRQEKVRADPDKKDWDDVVLNTLKLSIENYETNYTIGRTGRLSCMANRYPREVRDALLIDGEPTVEIDVKNCQPLLLHTLYESPCAESDRWKLLGESGTLYELFSFELCITRDDVKNLMFPFLYSSIGAVPELEEVMKGHFPKLMGLINETKKRHYKALCYDMQRKESSVTVDHMTTLKNIPVIPVHDAVYVKLEDVEEATRLMLAEFDRLYGLTPKVTIKKSSLFDDDEEGLAA